MSFLRDDLDRCLLPCVQVFWALFLRDMANRCLLPCVQVFWATGVTIEILMASLVIPTLGWRWLMAFSAVPVLVAAAFLLVGGWVKAVAHVATNSLRRHLRQLHHRLRIAGRDEYDWSPAILKCRCNSLKC